MSIKKYTSCAVGLAIAFTLSVTARAEAQVSQQRIPVRKDQGVTTESRGEVALTVNMARVDALEANAAALNQRIESLERANASLTTRTAESERMLVSLRDSLRSVSAELAYARREVAAATARTAALADTVYGLNRRLSSLRNGSLFGHSGFYVGAGTGANLATGTLSDIGYRTGLNFAVPFGWSQPNKLLGVRAELGVQSFNGRAVPSFVNPDPMLYSAIGMLTLNFPLNEAKNHLFYVMGGGGAFRFRDIGTSSALLDRMGGTSTSVTKFGVTGGAGFEFHVLGATSLFVESAFTNVFAEKSLVDASNGSRNLRWIPLVAGVTLR